MIITDKTTINEKAGGQAACLCIIRGVFGMTPASAGPLALNPLLYQNY